MDQGQQNIGSFGAAIGGGSALAEAMQRRGIDISALQQQSPAAMGTEPLPEPGIASAQAAMPATTPGTNAPTPEQQSQNPELMSAIEALGGFIKSEGKTRNDVVKARMNGLV